MSSEACIFYLNNGCNRGSSCTFSHQKTTSGTKSPRSSEICRYFLKGNCAFGNGCQRSHKRELKEANANYSYNAESSNSYESPADNGISRFDKGSAGEGNDVQEHGQDNLPGRHVLDPLPSEEIDKECAEPEVQDNGSSQDDALNLNVNIDEENVHKAPCIFFLEGSCGNDCDFSHSIPKDTEIASSGRRKGPKSSKSYLYSPFFMLNHVLPVESPIAPKPSDSPHKKVCKHYRQGHCHIEKDCKFLHPQAQQIKSLIKVPNTFTDPSCRLDSPFNRPIGEEDDNTSPEAHAHEFEGDTIVHDESQDKTDQAPSFSDDEFNGNHPGQPTYDDEAHEEQIDPSNPRHHTDNADSQVVEESYVSPVEPDNKSFKTSRPASYYGEGWEERSPPPPLATQLQAHQRATLLVVPSLPKYPHVSEIIPHWTQFADPHANKDVPFCKQLAQVGCSQGDMCRFRHSLTVEEYILLFNDQQPSLWTLQRDCINEAAVSSPALVQPQVDSPQISSTVASTFGQCKFYPIGKCRNGDLCPFQHIQHPIVPTATVSNADQNWQTSERPAFGTQRACKFYLERGYCSRGLSCKFGHGGHLDGDFPSSGPSGPELKPSVVDDKGWSTGREEGNKVSNNNPEADTPVEDNGWGAVAASRWDAFSNLEDHGAWDSPGGNDCSDQPLPRKSNVCFQYAEGRCHRGEACRFSHDQEPPNKSSSSNASKTGDDGWPPTDDSSHSAPWNTAPPVQCPYYLKGNCRNDFFCHMSHDSEEKLQEECKPATSYKTDQPINEPGENVHSTWETEGEPKTSTESQPKAQEGDSQDSHIVDNEASWSEPWPTETIQPPSFPIKCDAPCKRFGQGYCPYGDDCHYLHIEDADIDEPTSSSEGDVSVSMFLNRCTLAI